jgi:hypothetical protein
MPVPTFLLVEQIMQMDTQKQNDRIVDATQILSEKKGYNNGPESCEEILMENFN